MMLRLLPVLWVLSSMWGSSRGQPAECEVDNQCQWGSYCVPGVFVCRPCLRCDSLRREPPPVATECVKSVAECGPCVTGPAGDRASPGDGAECVSAEAGGSFPAWAAGALALGLTLFVAAAAFAYYMLRKNLFNVESIKTMTSTSVSPSAPEQPPPPYYPVPEAAPYTMPYTDMEHRPHDYGLHHGRYFRPDSHGPGSDSEGDALMESMKMRHRSGTLGDTERGRGDGRGDTRGTDGRQAATPYNNPDYVRVPPAEESVGFVDMSPPTHGVTPGDLTHDEDTAMSSWTPGTPDTHNDSGTGSVELTDLLSTARGTTLVRDPRTCSQETGNGRSTSSGAGGEGSFGMTGPSGAGMQAIHVNIHQYMIQNNDGTTKLSL